MGLTYKEYVIPKKGGKVRKIVAPSDELKLFQRQLLPTLLNNFEDAKKENGVNGKDLFHGFIPGKNCVTAATKHIGFKLTLMMDIKHFFDSVQSNFLPRKYHLPRQLFHSEGYAAQGFPSSPMVANIAIVPIMAAIHRDIGRLTNGDFALTIYADDIQVSLNNEATSYIKAIEVLIEQAFFQNGYIINKNKTRVKYAKHGWRRILGVNVGETSIRATRNTMRKIRAAKHQSVRSKTARNSAGGLTTWSKCLLPRIARPMAFEPGKIISWD